MSNQLDALVRQEAINDRQFRHGRGAGFDEFCGRFEIVPDFSGRSVLDFGCGRGGMAQRLLEEGAQRVLGIDLKPVAIDYARRKVAPHWDGRAQFACVDIRECAVERADLVVSMDTFEHVLNLRETLCSVVAACRPGGEIYLGFSPLWHSPFGHHRLIPSKIPWAHLPRANRAFLDQLRKVRSAVPETIQQLGFNGATPADFRAALDGLPVEVVSMRANMARAPLKRMVMRAMLGAAIIPALEKFVTIGLYWHLRRRKD